MAFDYKYEFCIKTKRIVQKILEKTLIKQLFSIKQVLF